MSTFADQFPVLGTGLKEFLENIGVFTDDQAATVECAANAVKTLASVASEIPNSGGWVGAIVGENDLSTFADQFPVLGTGLRGFLDKVGTFTNEEVATVECAAKAVKTLAAAASEIENSGGWIGAIVGENDLSTFADQFPALGTGIAGFVNEIGTFSAEKIETVNSAVKVIKEIAKLSTTEFKDVPKIGDKLPGLGKDISAFCNSMPDTDTVNSAITKLKNLMSVTTSITDANIGSLKSLAENLKKIGEDAVKKFVNAFKSDSAKDSAKNAAKALGDKAVEGLKDKKKTIKTEGENVAKEAVKGLKTQKDEAKTAGKNLGAGYVEGINAKKKSVYNAGYALGQQAASGINDGQKSNSPSKLAAQSGKWLGEGYIIGIGKMGSSVGKAGDNLGKTATNSLSSSISRISNMISSDIDSQPTIRPVLDLSDVESGAATLGSMLDVDSSVGVRANVGAISSMMSLRGQNGGNGDIISAIDKLSKKMDNVGNTSYTINGVTYDDGSNVANAVGVLTRAIRMERRV